jgi:hypothetical protein
VTKSRGILPPRRQWREDELSMLRARYADAPAAEIAKELGCKIHIVYAKAHELGLQKSDAFHEGPASGRLKPGHQIGTQTRFVKGGVSHNKHIKGYDPGGRSRETRFKKGQRPINWLPIGAYRVNSLGYLDTKVREDRKGALNWEGVHRLAWIETHGPIPPGHVVAFKPGRRTVDPKKITADALELITNAENGRRNIFHNRYPKAIGELIHLKAQITKQIRRREREEQN